MWTLYQFGLLAILACAAPFLLLGRGSHYLETLNGRLVRTEARGGAHDLWIHAVSVGEVGVAQTLVEALPADLEILVTTVTPTGQASALRSLGGRATVAYLPLDLGRPVERFLDLYSPRAAVFVEGELWPLLLHRLEQRHIPRILVNGRISDRNFRRLHRFGGLARRLLFDGVDHLGVQTAQDRERLLALGVDSANVTVTGNLKYETPEPGPLAELEAGVRAVAAGRKILLAGSTMPGEEELVAQAFQAGGGPDRALLVVAPRHPERWDPVARRLERLASPLIRRSEMAAQGTAREKRPNCLLLDSLGELASLYRVADGCFIGGTLVPTGGHNPLEPARFAKPIAVGPSMHNFREMAAHFDHAHAWERAANAMELGEIFARWIEQPEAAADLGARALALIERNRGATSATLDLLRPLLEPPT